MSLSLCMIVRDAERSLRQALESVRPFVDEMVVVDTGSTDQSREMASQLGARVHDFPWCDDFSRARNFSLDQASSDWIFWIDADDVLPAASGREIRRRIEQHPNRDAAFWVTVQEQARDASGAARVMGHAHLKVFPRHPEIRFQYRVHEQVSPAIKRLGIPFKGTTAVVDHRHADRSPGGQLARAQRNLRLLLLDLEEHPDDPFVLMNLGATYLCLPDGARQSVQYLNRSVSGFAHGSQTRLNACLYLGQAHGTAGDRESERACYRDALRDFPDDAVLLLRLAAVHEHLNELEEAAECYRAALDRGKIRRSSVHVRNGPAMATLRLGQIYVRMGLISRAEQLWQQFLGTHPHEARIRQALIDLKRRPSE